MTRLARVAALAAVCLVLAPAGTAVADWLVLRDRSRLETRDPWKVAGRQVIFHLPDGTLSSLRLSDVDVEASRTLTREDAEAAAAPAAEPEEGAAPAARPRRKLTNADIAAGARVLEPEPEPEAEEDDADGDASEPRTLEVVSWEEVRVGLYPELEIHGVVRNVRPDLTAARVEVEVILFDHEGNRLASAAAQVTPPTLAGREEGRFVAPFPDVQVFGALTFRTSSIDLVQEPAAEDEAPPER